MSLQYRPQVDDSDEVIEITRTDIVYSQMSIRGHQWPRIVGAVQIILGIIIAILGVTEVFFIPFAESKDDKDLILFNKQTCYACGIFAGILMVVTGSTFIRASLSQRNTTVHRFFHLTIFSLLIYTGFTILFIYAYSAGWTESDKYPKGSSLREIHFFLTLLIILGLLFAFSVFMKYHDIICCGEYPLWRPWLRCCSILCCHFRMCKRQMSFESLVSEDLHNRSNPI